MFSILHCLYIGIEAQLLSQADIDRGVNVTFPINQSNISYKSKVPNPTISMQTVSELYIQLN